MKQIHQKELEDKDEELEDVRQSCQRRVGWCRVGGMMLGAPQGSLGPQCRGGAVPKGPSSPGERWGGRALLSHHHPSMSPGHSPGVQNQGLGQA